MPLARSPSFKRISACTSSIDFVASTTTISPLRRNSSTIGSVLVYEGRIIGRGHNCRVQTGSPIDHGEMNCLRNAGRLSASVYQRCTIYSIATAGCANGGTLVYDTTGTVTGCTLNGIPQRRLRRLAELLQFLSCSCADPETVIIQFSDQLPEPVRVMNRLGRPESLPKKRQ